jgi:solute carrier family 25 protein 34/35
MLHIGKTEGIIAFYKGFSAFAGYRVFMNAPRLGLYEPLRARLKAEFPEAASQSPIAVDGIAGGLTGAIGACFGNPFNVIKTRCMMVHAGSCGTDGGGAASGAERGSVSAAGRASSNGLVAVARRIAAEEGFAGFMLGLSAGIPRVMVGSSSQLATYDYVKRALANVAMVAPGPNGEGGWRVHGLASLVASAVSTTCFCPFDVISSRLMTGGGQYAGFWSCFAATVKHEGWFALERGWLALYARTGPTSTLTLVLWEQLRRFGQPSLDDMPC